MNSHILFKAAIRLEASEEEFSTYGRDEKDCGIAK